MIAKSTPRPIGAVLPDRLSSRRHARRSRGARATSTGRSPGPGSHRRPLAHRSSRTRARRRSRPAEQDRAARSRTCPNTIFGGRHGSDQLDAKRSVARISSSVIPGVSPACPASSTMTSSEPGQTRCSSHALPERRLQVEPAVHEDTGDAGQASGVPEQLAVCEEQVVPHVVRDEPREPEREVGIGEPRREAGLRRPVGRRGFPQAPGAARRDAGPRDRRHGAAANTPPRRRRHDASAGRPCRSSSHCWGNSGASPPRNSQSASTRRPVVTPHSTIAETRSGCASAYANDEVAAPRPAEEQPPVDFEVPAQQLHVGDEMLGGVGREVDVGFARTRGAPPAAALVEQDDAVPGRIEEPPMPRGAARAGTAVHHQGGRAVGIAAGLPDTPGCRRRPRACRPRTARARGRGASWRRPTGRSGPRRSG